jgi:hypothetical protein
MSPLVRGTWSRIGSGDLATKRLATSTGIRVESERVAR